MKLFLRNNYNISLLENALLEVKENNYIATQIAYKTTNKSIAESLHVKYEKLKYIYQNIKTENKVVKFKLVKNGVMWDLYWGKQFSYCV